MLWIVSFWSLSEECYIHLQWFQCTANCLFRKQVSVHAVIRETEASIEVICVLSNSYLLLKSHNWNFSLLAYMPESEIVIQLHQQLASFIKKTRISRKNIIICSNVKGLPPDFLIKLFIGLPPACIFSIYNDKVHYKDEALGIFLCNSSYRVFSDFLEQNHTLKSWTTGKKRVSIKEWKTSDFTKQD